MTLICTNFTANVAQAPSVVVVFVSVFDQANECVLTNFARLLLPTHRHNFNPMRTEPKILGLSPLSALHSAPSPTLTCKLPITSLGGALACA